MRFEKSQEHFKTLFDYSNDGLFILDLQGNFIDINKTAYERLGYAKEEMLAMQLADLDPPGFSARIQERMALLKKHGEAIFETAHYRKDRSIMPVEINARIIELGGEKVLLSVIRDITERKVVEEKLQFTQFVTDHAPDCIAWVDEQARICYVNEAECREHGYTKEEMLAMSIPDIDPDFPADAWPAHWQELKQKGSLTFETRHSRKDGSIFPIEISANFVNFGGKEFNVAFARNITGRKQIEESLRASEERFQLAMQGANDGLWDWNLETDEVYYSPRWFAMLGYKADAFPARLDTWAKLVHPDDKDWVLQQVADYVEGRSDKYEFEMRMRHKDGHDVIILTRARMVVRESDGKPVRLVGTHVDITERKRAEEVLRESTEQLGSIFDNANDAIYLIDIETMRVLDCNRKASEMLGYSIDELKSLSVMGIHPKDELGMLPDKFREVIDKKTASGVSGMHHLTKDGRLIDIEFNSSLVEFSGKIVNLSIVRDVTERKQAENVLKDHVRRNRLILETTQDGFWIIGLDGRLTEVNDTYCRMSGYSRDELLSMRIADVEASESPAETQAHIRNIQKKGFDCFETMHRRKDGSTYHVEVSTSLTGEGTARIFFAFLRDISERKQSEQILREDADKQARFNKLAVGRELVMIELKKEINELLVGLGREKKYVVHDPENSASGGATE